LQSPSTICIKWLFTVDSKWSGRWNRHEDNQS